MSRPLIQIVPRRSISPEGVGDYSRLLAERFRADHDLGTVFVAGTPLPPEQRLHDEWPTHQVESRSANALLSLLDHLAQGQPVPILLHLSGYGFQDKGAALWLATALERWRRAHAAVPLFTVFHELFATGPVWGSAFWLGPVQAWVARRILAISTGSIATTSSYTAILRNWIDKPDSRTITFPVFSTIGEGIGTMRASERESTLAIFGRSGIFGPIYRDNAALLEAFVAEAGITRIMDIGLRDQPLPSRIGPAPVDALGELPPEALQAELGRARFGMLHYDGDRLAKSSIFAAYCAHGTIPICLTESAGNADGLRAGDNYLRIQPVDRIHPPAAGPALDELQSRVTSWYQPHSLQATADHIGRLLYSNRDQADTRIPCS